MLPRLLASDRHPEREGWLWLLICTLAVGQIIAFWMLCQWQVEQARARHAALQSDRVAMVTCSGATFVTADGTVARAAPGPRCEVVRQRSGKTAD